MRRWGLWFLPCLVLLSVTLPHLGQGDFRRDTGRYAAVGLYMWESGSLLAPHLNPDTPYFNKPPLATLIHGLFLKVFGPHLAVARLPSILAALGVVAFSIYSVRQIGSRAEAVVSGLVLALTYEFFRRTREISLDMWQLLFVMGAVCLALRALRSGSGLSMALAGVPLGLALLCKPLNALIVVPIFGLWALLGRRPQLLLPLLLGTLPLALLVALPWHLHMYSIFGDTFIRQYFFHEVVKRAQGVHGDLPYYYYAKENLATYWPWLPLLVFAVYHRFRGTKTQRVPARDLILVGGSWCLVVLVGLSLFPDKKPNYALPLYPMLSWMVAYGLCRLPWLKLKVWYQSGFRWLAPAAAALLAVLSLAPIRFQNPPDPNWQALFGWLKDHRVDNARLYYGTVQYNDLCYFYLYRGSWPQSAARLPRLGDASALVLTRLTGGASNLPPAAIVYSVGGLALVSGSTAVPVEILP